VDVPQGQFEIQRIPHDPRSPLRAWDAADEYVLAHIAELDEHGRVPSDARILIANDSFGALGVGLADRSPAPTVWTDSVRTEDARQPDRFADREGAPNDRAARASTPSRSADAA